MKKYPKTFNEKSKNFLALNVVDKFKTLLRISGIKFLIYNILYFSLSKIFKSKNYFIKALVFDLLKYNNELTIIKSKFNERFILFTNDNIISREMFVKKEFDLLKLKKTLNFLNEKKNIETIYDIGANIGVICIPAVKRGFVKNAFAVEPEKKNYELLVLNILLNNLKDKITPYNFALSDKDDDVVEMELASDNSGDHRVKNQINFNIHGEEERKTCNYNPKPCKKEACSKSLEP